MKRLLPLCIAACMMAAAPVQGAPGIEEALVQVIVSFQENDPFVPWRKRQPGKRIGYGVVIREGLLITTESLVRNHTLVELRRAATGEKLRARVETADPQVNLALVRILDDRAAEALPPVPLGAGLRKKDEVEILQFDPTRELQRGKAEVVRITSAELPRAPYHILTFTLLTDLNVDLQGAAVVENDKLMGLVMGYSRSERIAYMLPYSVIDRFLKAVDSPPYVGVPSAGFRWKQLVDPAKRAYLKLDRDGHGILVVSCVPGSGAAEVLRPNDVILEWDGRTIDNLGFYEDDEFGRMTVSFLIRDRREVGDTVTVKVWRDGREQDVRLRLANLRDDAALIPANVTGRAAEYLVEGGLLIREIDTPYLQARGNWQKKTDPRLVNLYYSRRMTPEKPGDRVVLLTTVLPDPINVGYQHFREQIITHVNGRPVRNMADVFAAADADGAVTRVTLQSIGVDLVLDKSKLPATNQRIRGQFRIPSLRYQRK